jgi:hypothetical protein
VQNAIENSMETFEVERSKTIIHNLNDVYSKLQELQLGDWTLLKKETNLYLLDIEESPAPVIKCYIKISEGLVITLNYQNQGLKRSPNKTYTFPFLTNNINDLGNLMSEVATILNSKSDINEDIADSVGQVIKLLTSMKKTIPDKEAMINFLQEQVGLLKTSFTNRLRFSWEFVLFCGLLRSISPSAYKFFRNSENLILQSLKTINECVVILQYIRSKVKHLSSKDKLVTLMMDEIHIKPYFDYKGGNIVGSAHNSVVAATTAHVFMISSMLLNYKDVVHIRSAKRLEGTIVHEIVKQIITGLENIGFEVLCVVCDNYSVNRKAMSLFCDNRELKNVYSHPVDNSRPLFFIIDSVHILKNIRNNWINKEPQHMIQGRGL